MSYKISENSVEFNIKININDLLFHLRHRCKLDLFTSKQYIESLFENDIKFRNNYLNLCEKTIEGFAKNQLDEVDDIIDFAEKIKQPH